MTRAQAITLAQQTANERRVPIYVYRPYTRSPHRYAVSEKPLLYECVHICQPQN